MTLQDCLVHSETYSIDCEMLKAMAERLGGHASDICITTMVGVMEIRLVFETYVKDDSWEIIITSGVRRLLVIALYATMADCLGSDCVVEASQKMASGDITWSTNPPKVLCSRRSNSSSPPTGPG